MVYCTPSDVKKICPVEADEIQTSGLLSIIENATTALNKDIGYDIIEEEATYIDAYRQNKKDGVNKVFYPRDSRKYYIGDRNDDGSVTIADVRVYLYDSGAGTISEATVSSVDHETGAITLSTAPATSTSRVTLTYRRVPVDVSTPDPIVKRACAHLAAAMVHLNIRSTDFPNLRLGDLSMGAYSNIGNSTFKAFMGEYSRLISLILAGNLRKGGSIIVPPYMRTYDGEP